MPPIRKFFLEAICLCGAVVGIGAAIGGYLSNLPERPERIAIAALQADPETTGAIMPKDEAASRRAMTTERIAGARQPEKDAAEAPSPWTDPPRLRRLR